MFINRPLIHGIANKKVTSTHSQPKKDSKGNIRVKTLPSQSAKKISKSVMNVEKRDDDLHNDNNLIGIKDIKQMIDNDLQSLLRRVQQFENQTIDEQQKIIKKQSKSRYKSIVHNTSQMIKQAKQQSQQEQRVYEQCREMLQARRQQEERMYERLNGAVEMKIKEEKQRRLELEEVMKNISEEINKIKMEISKIQQSISFHKKKIITKQSLLQQIQLQHKSIQHSNQQLFLSKQQSMKQKNQFIEVQAEQIKILKQIQQQNEIQLKFKELYQQEEYYRKTEKLKRKLQKVKHKKQNNVNQHIKQKIDQMTALRVNNDKLQEQTVQLQVKIHQQLAVIQLLTNRNLQLQQSQQVQSSEQDHHLSSKYRHKYQQLFLNKNNHTQPHQLNYNDQLQQQQQQRSQYSTDSNVEQDIRELNHWQNYKAYLQKILRNQQKLSALTSHNQTDHDSSAFVITTKANSQIFYTDRHPHFNDKHTKSFMRHSTNVESSLNDGGQKLNGLIQNSSKRNSLLKNHFKPKNDQSLIEQSSKPRSSLPRLVKMQGSLKDKDKIKNQLTKFTNQQYDQEIELQTVKTSQADGEQIIEVEFRGKKEPSSKENIS